MKLHFVKMHGLGNDFVVINAISQPFDRLQTPINALSDRHTGIGFDQLLVIEPAKNADFFCRIYNADGSEAEQCGNGLRCVARFIDEHHLNTNKHFRLETVAGIFPIEIKDYQQIRVTLDAPNIKNKLTELQIPHSTQPILVSVLSVGNPHAVVKVESIATYDASSIATAIAAQPLFPHGVNVGFMQIVSPEHILLRTIERGAGETLACGSNACAAAATGIANGWLKNSVTVEFQLGSLLIEWEGKLAPMHMTGSAANVYSGVLEL